MGLFYAANGRTAAPRATARAQPGPASFVQDEFPADDAVTAAIAEARRRLLTLSINAFGFEAFNLQHSGINRLASSQANPI